MTDLIHRLRESVADGAPDRISDLLEEASDALERADTLAAEARDVLSETYGTEVTFSALKSIHRLEKAVDDYAGHL